MDDRTRAGLVRGRRRGHSESDEPRQPGALGARLRRQLRVPDRAAYSARAARYLQGPLAAAGLQLDRDGRHGAAARAASSSASSWSTTLSRCRAFAIPQSGVRVRPRARVVVAGLQARCDYTVRIPTSFCINVAVAGAIVMYDRMLTHGRFAERPVMPGGTRSRWRGATGLFGRTRRDHGRALRGRARPVWCGQPRPRTSDSVDDATDQAADPGGRPPGRPSAPAPPRRRRRSSSAAIATGTSTSSRTATRPICYMASEPKKQEGNYTRRGSPAVLVTRRPGAARGLRGQRRSRLHLRRQQRRDRRSTSASSSCSRAASTPGRPTSRRQEPDRGHAQGTDMTVRGNSSKTPTRSTPTPCSASRAAYDAMTEACASTS